jgi:hypothetical protein
MLYPTLTYSLIPLYTSTPTSSASHLDRSNSIFNSPNVLSNPLKSYTKSFSKLTLPYWVREVIKLSNSITGF